AVLVCGGLAVALRSDARYSLVVVVLTIGFYIAISAATRPAQRYLILVLPLAMWWLICEARMIPLRRMAFWAAPMILLSAGLSGMGMAYLQAQGATAEAMAGWVSAHGLADQTRPDPFLRSHAGNYFPVEPPADARYETVTVSPGQPPPRGIELH